jgi:transposase
MRPIWHHVARRVKAHIFVAALAFLIERMLERALKEAGLNLSAQSALQAVQTIRTVQFHAGGERRSGVTPGSSHARQVLRALGLSDYRPPVPPPGEETTT